MHSSLVPDRNILPNEPTNPISKRNGATMQVFKGLRPFRILSLNPLPSTLTRNNTSSVPAAKLKQQAMASFKIILGSSSASRKQILSDMGYQFTVMGANIDEKQIRREKPEDLVMALAEAKADAILAKLKENGFEEGTSEPTLLITADQVVLHGGEIREKPRDADEARQFIKGYSKGHASTVGSVMVTNLKTGVRKGDWDKAEIYFHEIPEEVIDNLIKEGDIFYVAGGLMVEHPLTSPFVGAMVGTIDSIMGLPKDLTERLIKEAIGEK